MGGVLHLVQQGGDWAGLQPAQPLLTVPNVTARSSILLLYTNNLIAVTLLLCSFNYGLKGLRVNHILCC